MSPRSDAAEQPPLKQLRVSMSLDIALRRLADVVLDMGAVIGYGAVDTGAAAQPIRRSNSPSAKWLIRCRA
jgi:hypothetical protein